MISYVRRICGTLAVFHALSAVTHAVNLPVCQTVAPNTTILSSVHTAFVNVTNTPFGLTYSPSGANAFVALNSTLGVFDTSSFVPVFSHNITLPEDFVYGPGAAGVALSHDGQHVFIAAGPGIVVVDVARAIANNPDAVVGALNTTTAVNITGLNTTTPIGRTAIEVTLSPDDQYAFVSIEVSSLQSRGAIEVYKLNRTSADGSVKGELINVQPLDYDLVGTALSPDGKLLYAVTESQDLYAISPGIITVIDVDTITTYPGIQMAIVTSALGACGNVRVIASSDGSTIWVTARESNHLLAYDAQLLATGDPNALKATVQVGTSPVGLTFAKNETRILTADSNRHKYAGTTTGLSVVDVQAALSGNGKAVLGHIPTGLFPREVALSPDGNEILVADYASKQVQVVDVTTIP